MVSWGARKGANLGVEGSTVFLYAGGWGPSRGGDDYRPFFGQADLEGEGGAFATHDEVLSEECVQPGEAGG